MSSELIVQVFYGCCVMSFIFVIVKVLHKVQDYHKGKKVLIENEKKKKRAKVYLSENSREVFRLYNVYNNLNPEVREQLCSLEYFILTALSSSDVTISDVKAFIENCDYFNTKA